MGWRQVWESTDEQRLAIIELVHDAAIQHHGNPSFAQNSLPMAKLAEALQTSPDAIFVLDDLIRDWRRLKGQEIARELRKAEKHGS